MTKQNNKPESLKQTHLEFLDVLRDSGVTNMFGAVPYLIEEFSYLDKKDAKNILLYWMKTFSQRREENNDNKDI